VLHVLRDTWRKNAPELIAAVTGGLPAFITNSAPHELDGVPVFCYHAVSGAVFESHLRFLQDNEYQTLTADEFVSALRSFPAGSPPIRRRVVISFDDGLLDLHDTVFPLLRRYAARAVAFIAPAFHASRRSRHDRDACNGLPTCSWEQIEAMHASSLVDFQSHTFEHRLMYDWPRGVPLSGMSEAACDRLRGRALSVADDLAQARDMIERRLGKSVRHLAFPQYDGTPDAIRIGRACGYDAFYWGTRPRKALNRRGDELSFIVRLSGEFLPRLPGRGRVPLRRILRDRFAPTARDGGGTSDAATPDEFRRFRGGHAATHMKISSVAKADAAVDDRGIGDGTSVPRTTSFSGVAVNAPERSRRHRWLVAAQVSCTSGLLAWLLWQIDLGALRSSFATIRWSVVVILLGIGLLERFLTTWKYHLLLVATNIRLGLMGVFRIQMIATFFGSFLPTAVGHEAVRIYLLSKATSRTADAISVSTVDRLLSVLASLAAATVAAAVTLVIIPGPAPWSILVGVPVLIGALAVLAQKRLVRRFRPLVASVLGERAALFGTQLYQSFHAFSARPGAVAASCGVMVLSIGIRVLFVQVAAAALNVHVSLGALSLALPLTWVATMMPISIGALGLQEAAYVVALGSVGVPAEAAVAISLLEQLLTRLISLLGALFWLEERRFDVTSLRRRR
jgi:uncharacterized protein (TIRG00374 family)